ncbi:MAG: RNA methyltransferase [Thermodesulfobacteriota bacterium]|nr:RNA methyltransferase [Thermodesulfobacteriota bacterium]
MTFDNTTIILVEPQGPLNIGAVCRAMMNFGFSRLKLVNPCQGYRSREARKMALKSLPILENAEIHQDLISALKGCHCAFGTTRRSGKYRQNFLTPETAGKKIAELPDDIKCAIVLGREDNGLTTSELSLCQYFVAISTHNAFPSMNLSHALTVCLYEISKHGIKNPLKKTFSGDLADISKIERMYAHMKQTLLSIDFLNSENPDHILRTFRRIFGRAVLETREVNIIHGLMNRIDWTEGQRRKAGNGQKKNKKQGLRMFLCPMRNCLNKPIGPMNSLGNRSVLYQNRLRRLRPRRTGLFSGKGILKKAWGSLSAASLISTNKVREKPKR